MESAFGIDHGEFSKGIGVGLTRLGGSVSRNLWTGAGKLRGAAFTSGYEKGRPRTAKLQNRLAGKLETAHRFAEENKRSVGIGTAAVGATGVAGGVGSAGYLATRKKN